MRTGSPSLPLLAALLLAAAATLRPAAAAPPPEAAAVRGMRIEPSTAKVIVGRARLSVEGLTRAGEGLSGGYKVEVSPIPVGNESGKLSVKVSGEELRRLAGGQAIQFTGQAVNAQGGRSEVRGTAMPSGDGGGALRVHIDSKRGKLVFNTTYHLER